jgi:UDP-N-acetylglucosamine acyltransferase
MIHPTAIVHPGARLGAGVSVGPYSLVGEHVEIGDGTTIAGHAVVEGHTRIGRDNRIFQFASLGSAPQDKKYRGEPTRLEIGDGNTFREFSTINTGTTQDAGLTRIGDDNWFMAYSHVAHDCIVGSHTIFANNASLAGHVHVGDWVIFAGFTGVHQFCRIGAHSFVGHGVLLPQDLPPYVMVAGEPPQPRGINSEGLRRRGFGADAIARIKQAYRTLYRAGLSLEEAAREIAREAEGHPELKPLADFLATPGRGIVR